MRRRARGFTLLEVLVAMVLVGVGVSLAFAAMSGATRLTQRATLHDNASRLARAKLEEVLASPNYDLAEDGREDVYAGVRYGYKIQIKPVQFPGLSDERTPLPFMLDLVSIDVYWGPEQAQQSYTVSTYRYAPRTLAAPTQSGNSRVTTVRP